MIDFVAAWQFKGPCYFFGNLAPDLPLHPTVLERPFHAERVSLCSLPSSVNRIARIFEQPLSGYFHLASPI